jgi:hypothetical protein
VSEAAANVLVCAWTSCLSAWALCWAGRGLCLIEMGRATRSAG